MASFGENLRREREMRGVGLEEISSATKISVRFFQALEAEAFSKLPGGIFTRSFIRAYSKYLGLDEEHVLAEYHLAAQPTTDIDLNRLGTYKPAVSGGNLRAPFIGVAVAGAMLTGAYLLFRYTHSMPEQQGTLSNPASTSAEPSPSPPQQQLANNPGATPAVGPTLPASTGSAAPATSGSPSVPDAGTSSWTELGSSPKAAEDTGGLILQVAVTEKAWLAIDADGKTARQRVFEPHEVETFKAKDYFDVTTGNAQGTLLTLNGEMLKPLGRHGEYKKVHLTREDIKNPAP